MKVALVVDQLIYRDLATFHLEGLLPIFENVEIFCVAHAPGRVLGPAERYNIHSTYLSNFVTTTEQYHKWKVLSPGAVKSAASKEKWDIAIHLSCGHAHLFEFEGAKTVTFLFEKPKNSGGMSSRFFGKYLTKKQMDSLSKSDRVFFNEGLFDDHWIEASSPKSATFKPFIKWQDYEFGRVGQDSLSKNILCSPAELESPLFKALFRIATQKGFTFQVVGEVPMKKQTPWEQSGVQFIGERCPGDISKILDESFATMVLASESFPMMGILSLGAGRPLLMSPELKEGKFFSSEHGVFFNRDDLAKGFSELSEHYDVFPGKKLRNYALRWNESAFKGKLKKSLEELFPQDQTDSRASL